MREAGRLFAQADTPPDDMIPATQSEP
jgi:hypothetical protein